MKGAATATEMSRRNHYNGLHRMPGYRGAFEKVDQEVDDSFLAILVDRTVNGFTEARFSCSSVLCSPSSRGVVSFPHSDTGGDTIRPRDRAARPHTPRGKHQFPRRVTVGLC